MPSVIEQEADLGFAPAEVRRALAAEFARTRKSVLWAYVLWGAVGAHYAYLGRRREQTIFALTLGGLGVWWLADAVRIPRLVESANADLRRRLVTRYHLFAPVSAPGASGAPAPQARRSDRATAAGVAAARH